MSAGITLMAPQETMRSPEDDVSHAGFTPASLKKLVSNAQQFHKKFLASSPCDAGLYVSEIPDWGAKLIRRSGGITQAIIAKLGSNSFSKRRPTDTAHFLAYLEERYAEGAPLLFRIGTGPVKNAQQYGAAQAPDLAEYLMFIHLAKVMEAIAAIYPYGIRVQMIPDDLRGGNANCWPSEYSKRYIAGLRRLAKELRFESWLDVEEGQSRIYAAYEVEKHLHTAEQDILRNPDCHKNLAIACMNAKQNVVSVHTTDVTESMIRESALRYMINHKAEMLSGIWTPKDAFPIRYGNHSDNFQLYTMGAGLTKLPWQIRLPISLLNCPSL